RKAASGGARALPPDYRFSPTGAAPNQGVEKTAGILQAPEVEHHHIAHVAARTGRGVLAPAYLAIQPAPRVLRQHGQAELGSEHLDLHWKGTVVGLALRAGAATHDRAQYENIPAMHAEPPRLT